MGITFDNPLRNYIDALYVGRWVRSAVRQHLGCFLSLDNIHPQGGDAVCVQVHKFNVGHLGEPVVIRQWYHPFGGLLSQAHKSLSLLEEREMAAAAKSN